MDTDFWHRKWESNKIGFHEPEGNALLVTHFDALNTPQSGRVFVPLCGKTRDIAWFLSAGYRVAGAELNQSAVEALFQGLGVDPKIRELGPLTRFSAPNIDIFVGDIFALSREVLGPVDVVFDRAALVALPETMRPQYAKHLIEMTDNAPQFLITFEYDQALMAGPPFSVVGDEVSRHYQTSYDISSLAHVAVTDGLKVEAATENVWLLKRPA